MDMHNGQNNDQDLEAPAKLIAALRELPRESVFVPPTIDEVLFKAARHHLTKTEKKGVLWFLSMRWSLASAGLAMAVLLTLFTVRQFDHAKVTGFSREDLNRDGHVDILDAFALAKKLQTERVSDLRFDIDRNGVVDRRDAERIAIHAVSLDKGGRS